MKKTIKAITGLSLAMALFLGSMTANTTPATAVSGDQIDVTGTPTTITAVNDWYIAVGSSYVLVGK